MYISKEKWEFNIPLKSNWVKIKLYLNTMNKADFLELSKLKDIDISTMILDILYNLKRQNNIYLGWIQSIHISTYKNKVFLKSNKKHNYSVENIFFQEDYITKNIDQYYDINQPIIYKWKNFFKLKPVYAVIFALKEDISFGYEPKFQTFVKQHNIQKSDILDKLPNIVRNLNQRTKIKQVIDFTYTEWALKIKLKYNNADYQRFDTFSLLLDFLFFKNTINELQTKLNPYLNIDPYKLLFWHSNYYFYETYFSNYIEWIKFDIHLSKELIDQNNIIEKTDDTECFINYYKSIKNAYTSIFEDTDFLSTLLKENKLQIFLKNIHKNLFSHKNIVWKFKTRKNMVNWYVFVYPEKVEDTLKMAVELFNYYYKDFKNKNPNFKLTTKIIAIILFLYLHFVITEVHPFTDGNWRITRIAINLILVSAWLSPVIITNKLKKSYFQSLKQMWKQDVQTYFDKMINILNYQTKFDYVSAGNDLIMEEERNENGSV